MRKISTILFTIFILCISSVTTFATCSDLYSHGSMSISSFDVYYWTTSSTSEIIQVVNPPSTYYTFPADTNFIRQINVYSQTNRIAAAKLYQFSGFFEFVNTHANDLNFNYPTNFAAPVLIGDDGHEIGYCDIPTVNINQSVSRYYNGSDFYSYKTIPFSVQCHSNGYDRPAGMSFPLNFASIYGPLNQYSFTVSPYLYSGYTYSNNEYDYNFCTLQEAIQNISFSDSGITGVINNSTQDIINNNNSNTQQIVDQLTNQTCTQEQCSNIIDISSFSSTTYHGFTYTYSGQKVTLSGSADSTRNYNLLQGWNINNYYLSGDYVFRVNQALPYELTVSNDLGCKLAVGQTSVVCHSSSGQHYYNLQFRSLPANSSLNIVDLEVFLSSNLTQDFCSYGSTLEHCSGSNKLDNISNSIDNVNDTLNDSSADGVSSEFQDIINDFNFNDHGLTSFLLIPVNAAQNLLTATCTPVHLQFPYLNNKSVDLPCYSPIFDSNFSTLMILIRICTNGIIAYYCVMQIYKMMINLSNPDHANIEVFEL